jgi:hypothetical protein
MRQALTWHQSERGGPRGKGSSGGGLSRQADYFGPFFVLAGLAVENHLKARILERRIAAGQTIPDGTAVVDVFPRKAHDLIVLAESTDVSLTPSTRALLQRLSSFVVWAGPLSDSQESVRRGFRPNDARKRSSRYRRFHGSLNT